MKEIKIELSLVSDLQRDNVYIELYYGEILWGELSINPETDKGELHLFSDELTMPYEEVIKALQYGYKMLQPLPPKES